MSFKKWIIVLGVMMLGAIWMVGCGKGEKAETPGEKAAPNKPLIMRTSTVTLNATIESVDLENRTFTLKDESGNTQTFQVKQPDAPLDELKPGTPVKMTIVSKDLYYVAAEGAQIPENISEAGVEKSESEKEITVTRQQTQNYVIKAVDAQKRTLQLSTDNGNPFELTVQDNAVDLSQLKPGDTIVNKSIQIITMTIQ